LLIGVQVLALPFPILIASLVLFARMSGPAQLLQASAVRSAAYAPAFLAIERRLGRLESVAIAKAAILPIDWRKLIFDGVGFEHGDGLGVQSASLTIARGEWLGLKGASGAGKTTLVDLVAGLLAPGRGTIALDGNALNGEVLERWRSAIAYVGQEGSVFSDSVRGNLLAEGAKADNVSLWQVLDIVGLAERVRAFPDGLNQSVGDRGSQLSGGERQRLIIARALLRRPSLLILDEATAALDGTSETELIGRVKGMEPRPAALVVAHRQSTLSHCDSVASIRHGVVRLSARSRRVDKDGGRGTAS
jgi:ABC-type multidrug transport system fused ATPase/permease subunit